MFTLYMRNEKHRLLYFEAWEADRQVVEHWGACGERGETRFHSVRGRFHALLKLEALRRGAESRGYKPIPEEEMVFLVVEYPIDGWGSTADLERRHRLEDEFNELVGWLGLGHVDGGSTGAGTMDVAILVVDFEIAKEAIEANTEGTAMAGFSRIHLE